MPTSLKVLRILRGLGLYISCTWTPAVAVFLWDYLSLQHRLAGDWTWPEPRPPLLPNLPLVVLSAGMFAAGAAAYLAARPESEEYWAHGKRARNCASVVLEILVAEAASALLLCAAVIIYSVYGMIALHVPINDPGPVIVIFSAGTMLLASLLTGAVSCTVGCVMGMAVSASFRPGCQKVAATGSQRQHTTLAAVAIVFIGFTALNVVALACLLRATTAPHPGSLGAASEPAQLGLVPTLVWLVLTGNIWAYVAAAAIAFRRNPRSHSAWLLATIAVPLAAFGIWCVYRGDISLFLL